MTSTVGAPGAGRPAAAPGPAPSPALCRQRAGPPPSQVLHPAGSASCSALLLHGAAAAAAACAPSPLPSGAPGRIDYVKTILNRNHASSQPQEDKQINYIYPYDEMIKDNEKMIDGCFNQSEYDTDHELDVKSVDDIKN
jgi:hypothetical protein